MPNWIKDKSTRFELFEYSCTPLNIEQVSGQKKKKRFEKVQLATGSFQAMSGVRFSLKPSWSVSNTLVLQSFPSLAWSALENSAVNFALPCGPRHCIFRKMHTRIVFTCLILTKEDNTALHLSEMPQCAPVHSAAFHGEVEDLGLTKRAKN